MISCTFLPKPGTLGAVTVIVDTKVARNAVTRNLCKRRIRASLRERGLPQGMLIVRLLKGAAELSSTELIGQLDQCLRRLQSSR